MFLDDIGTKEKLWKFRLLDGVEIIGYVGDYRIDMQGHPIMLSIWPIERLLTSHVPWTSIVHIEEMNKLNYE